MEFVKKNKNKKNSSSSLKVVYISSPMKVKTTASKFRSLVQALTGRDSDITKSMDIVQTCNNNNNNHFPTILPSPPLLPHNPTTNFNLSSDNIPINEQQQQQQHHQQQHNFLDYFSYPILDDDQTTTHEDTYSPTSSESLIDQQSFGGGGGEPFGVTSTNTQVEDDQYLQDVFTSSLFTDQFSLQGHLIGCYDAL